MAISNAYLLGLYGGGTALGSTAAPVSVPTKKAQPTAPWTTAAQTEAPPPDVLVRRALAGRRFVDEDTAQIDVKGASADYRKLFALYRGLETLTALANRASVAGLSANDLSLVQRRFATGLSEIGSYVSRADFDGLRLVQGSTASISKTSAAVPRDSAMSVTGPVHEGALETPVAAFQGDTRFGITVRVPAGLGSTTTTVDIDLADMGSTPRTLDAVLGHINGKLEAAGFATRIGRDQIKAEPRTVQANGRTVTLPAGPDRWALAIRGVSTETVGFTAPQVSDAVYVVQSNGAAQGRQLLKFQSDGAAAPPTGPGIGETRWVDGRLAQDALPEGIAAVRASAAAPDGGVWILADVTSGPAGQPIKGVQDVALMKYDSAGRLVATRALGAASSASGYALAVDASGQVAVAGSVTGALNTSATDAGKAGEVATLSDSFVTVFDAQGEELWTQRRGARAEDQATSVAFGPDGVVYIGGRARSAVPGTSAIGGWDGYVQAFKGGEPYPTAGIRAQAVGQAQFGTSAEDGVDAVTVDGANLYTAGIEDGRAVVRRFSLDAAGIPTLAATRDLGPITGSIAGVAVANGRVVLTGTSQDAGLTAGTVNTPASGGTDVFVAALATDLSASPDDRLTWHGTAGEDSAASVQVHAGKVWIAGVENRAIGAGDDDPVRGYLARIDPLTGTVEYRRDWTGDDDQARPLALAVSTGGASVLDRLGLPKGEIDQSDSKRLIDATSLRVGDRFYVSPADGGRASPVTIEAKDTLASLARKISIASGGRLKVTVASEAAGTGPSGQAIQAGLQRLSITARDDRSAAVLTSGETGRDALLGLGLSPGYIGQTSGDDTVRTFGLSLPSGLTLSDPAAVKAAGEKLQGALKAIRDAYRALAPQPGSSGASGPVPAYLSNQLANYQAALARLGG